MTTIWLNDTRFICKDFTERRVEKDFLEHDFVELVGGPLDGKKLKESDMKFSHNVSDSYILGGCIYAPERIALEKGKRVLKLKYVGAQMK